MACSTDSSWLTRDRRLRKPCCAFVIRCLTWLYSLMHTQRSSILPTMGSNDIGLYCSAGSLRSFLWTGVTFADFHSNGTWPVCKERLNNSHMLGAISRAHTCNRRTGMPSGPHAFEVSRARKNCATSSTSRVIYEMFPSLSVRSFKKIRFFFRRLGCDTIICYFIALTRPVVTNWFMVTPE
jgi:hypothetical protein